MGLLRCVCRARAEGIGLTALTRETGMSKATVHRMMLALMAEGMVEQDEASRRYHLGVECYVLGSAASQRHGLHHIAAPILSRVANECGDTAFLTVANGSYSVCVLREDGDYPIKTHALMPGDRHPLGVGAGSLALLAAMPDEDIEACLESNAELIAKSYPHYSLSLLHEQVQQTRAQGYALNEGLVLPGSWGVGVPLQTHSGDILGALSIAAPDSRMRPERQPELVQLLKQAAVRLLAKLPGPDQTAASTTTAPSSKKRQA